MPHTLIWNVAAVHELAIVHSVWPTRMVGEAALARQKRRELWRDGIVADRTGFDE